jgi:hypothetical protein
MYQWSLWLSEEEKTAYVTVNSSGSGGALHPISFEMGKELKDILDELTERTHDTPATPKISIDQSS